MYRFLLLFLMMVACAAGLFFGWPWYIPALAGFIFGGLLPVWRRGGLYFAFLGGFFVWGVYSGYIHFESEGRLSDRLAVTFGVGTGWVLVLLTALWGGITAGLGGWFGAAVRRTLVALRVQRAEAARTQVQRSGAK